MADPTLANFIEDTTVDWDDIPATYEEFIDLGTDYIFRGFDIYSTLDTAIVIKFTNSSGDKELVIPPNWGNPLPDFRYNDVIEIKHNGVAPTEGFVKMENWRAE